MRKAPNEANYENALVVQHSGVNGDIFRSADSKRSQFSPVEDGISTAVRSCMSTWSSTQVVHGEWRAARCSQRNRDRYRAKQGSRRSAKAPNEANCNRAIKQMHFRI